MLRRHRALLPVLLLAGPLLFANLGAPLLWSDEADTAVFARTILRTGLPRAWDGTTFTDSDRGRRLASNLVMVGTPWVPYYLTAASFAVFGESPTAARLPFALAGLASVGLLYALVQRASGDQRAALAASLLFVASVQFLLYARECRHYSLNILLSLTLLLGFLRLDRPRAGIGFVVAAALLFHTHPLPVLATLAALCALSLLPPFRTSRRRLWRCLPFVVALTLPWALLSRSGWGENSQLLSSAGELPARLWQFTVAMGVAVPAVAWLVLGPLAWRRLPGAALSWLALAGMLLASYALLTPLLLSDVQLWDYGLRYVCAVLPLAAGVTGTLVVHACRGRPAIMVAVLGLLVLTHLGGNAIPWLLSPDPGPRVGVRSAHMPRGAVAKVLRTEWLGFLRGLWETSPGTDSTIVEFLRRHATPADRVITNYAWEPLYFYTGLPQALKVLPEYEIYPAAQRADLPAYVFGVEGARWLVWRWPWEGYQGYEFGRVQRSLEAGGARLVRMASFPDTIWENRPELAFHRFPGLGYLYPRGKEFLRLGHRLEAVIFRVEEAAIGPRRSGGADAARARAVVLETRLEPPHDVHPLERLRPLDRQPLGPDRVRVPAPSRERGGEQLQLLRILEAGLPAGPGGQPLRLGSLLRGERSPPQEEPRQPARDEGCLRTQPQHLSVPGDGLVAPALRLRRRSADVVRDRVLGGRSESRCEAVPEVLVLPRLAQGRVERSHLEVRRLGPAEPEEALPHQPDRDREHPPESQGHHPRQLRACVSREAREASADAVQRDEQERSERDEVAALEPEHPLSDPPRHQMDRHAHAEEGEQRDSDCDQPLPGSEPNGRLVLHRGHEQHEEGVGQEQRPG
jgi:4-amino-4-deoxy-L-arabinose transferase-like glycosyltransferase